MRSHLSPLTLPPLPPSLSTLDHTHLQVECDDTGEYPAHGLVTELVDTDHVEVPQEACGDRVPPPTGRTHGPDHLHVHQLQLGGVLLIIPGGEGGGGGEREEGERGRRGGWKEEGAQRVLKSRAHSNSHGSLIGS